LKEKVEAPVSKTENTAVGMTTWHRLSAKIGTSGGRSFGIVRSWTQATEFSLEKNLPALKGIKHYSSIYLLVPLLLMKTMFSWPLLLYFNVHVPTCGEIGVSLEDQNVSYSTCCPIVSNGGDDSALSSLTSCYLSHPINIQITHAQNGNT
jgi:hypothetical protein